MAGDNSSDSPALIVVLCYFAILCIVIIAASFASYRNVNRFLKSYKQGVDDSESCINVEKIKLYVNSIWKMKLVYGAVFTHTFDVATDIGVIIEW